jgi:tetratricopeptide (TPR) repeat protein
MRRRWKNQAIKSFYHFIQGGMMAKKKRVTRKKLLKEPDEFITTTGRLIRWSQKYRKPLSYAAGSFFVLLVAMAGYRYFANQAENTAFQLLNQATVKYENRLNAVGPEKAYQETKEDFEYILNKYKSKNGGKLARAVYANINLDAGNMDQAILLYEQVLKDQGKDKSFRNFILSSLGYAYEKKNDLKTALTYFEKIVEGEDPMIKDVALFNQGRLYESLGNGSRSKDAYKRLVSEYSDSVYFEIAKEKNNG